MPKFWSLSVSVSAAASQYMPTSVEHSVTNMSDEPVDSCNCYNPASRHTEGPWYRCNCRGPSACQCTGRSAPCTVLMQEMCWSVETGECKPTCGSGGWPWFASQQELQKSHWGKYFTSLYGELPQQAGTSAYPLRLASFWSFYLDKMSAAKVSPPPSVGTCPTSSDAPDGQRYDENNAYSSKDLTWLWHPLTDPVYQGFASHSIVEVSHRKDPFGDEHHGMWFLYAKGSGVYLDIGKTLRFADHDEAYSFFKTGKNNEQMCQAAAAKGYDSVQFLSHRDGINYPCAKKIGASWMNVEIVAVKLIGSYPCGQAQGTAPALRAGWGGDKACKCDPNNPNANCVFS